MKPNGGAEGSMAVGKEDTFFTGIWGIEAWLDEGSWMAREDQEKKN